MRHVNVNRLKRGEYHALVQEMRLHDHDNFCKYFRMTPARFDSLLRLVGPAITRKTTNFRSPVPPGERLAVTLRFLATGDSMQTIAFSYRLGHSTVCNIIDETCEAIWNSLSGEFLKKPSNEADWKQISTRFYRTWNFPHCVGAIDGKHVLIQAPPSSGSSYYNYKHTHSIVLMAVCDAQYCFTLLDIGDYGRHSDGGVLNHSNFGQAMENGTLSLPAPESLPDNSTGDAIPYVFVGDAAFPLRLYMMRPYPGHYLEETRRIFNYRLSRARRVIENAFGILAARFRVFRRPIIASAEKAVKITKAACCLHNYLKIMDMRDCASSPRQYCPPGFVDHEDPLGNIIPGDWRSEALHSTGLSNVSRTGSNTYSHSAASVREAFKTFFVSPEGQIDWQYRHVRS